MVEVKSTEERQKEIVQAAKQLFFSKGYTATSTTDIMKAVGIAKGTLYYHFSSKEEILNALLEDITDKMVGKALKVCEADCMSPVEKMVNIIRVISINGTEDGEIINTLHLPENALFHEKSHELCIKKITPIMLKAVNEGIDKGIFKTDYPYSAVHVALLYSMTAFEDAKSLTEDLIKGFIYNLERMLGADKGSLDMFLELFM